MPENNTSDNGPLTAREVNYDYNTYYGLVADRESSSAQLEKYTLQIQENVKWLGDRVEASLPLDSVTMRLAAIMLQNDATSVDELKQAEQQIQELDLQVVAARGETAVWLSSEQAEQGLPTTSRRDEKWRGRERSLYLHFGVLAIDATLRVRSSGELVVPMSREARAEVPVYDGMCIDEEPLKGLFTTGILEEIVPDSGSPEMVVPRLKIIKNTVVIIGNQAVDEAIERAGNVGHRQTLRGFRDEIKRPRE